MTSIVSANVGFNHSLASRIPAGEAFRYDATFRTGDFVESRFGDSVHESPCVEASRPYIARSG